MKKTSQRSNTDEKHRTPVRSVEDLSQADLAETIMGFEMQAIAEGRPLTQDNQHVIADLKRRFAEKISTSAAKIKHDIVRNFGPIQLPVEIPVERILQESIEGRKRFNEDLIAETKRLRKKEQRRHRGRIHLELFKGDFLEQVKDYKGQTRRRLGALSELVTQLPYFDWRLSGTVPLVRKQGACDSCWAFAAVAAFESRLMYNAVRLHVYNNQELTFLKSIGLSVQDVLAGLTDGKCLGGNYTNAFDLFVQQGGLVLDFNEYGAPIDAGLERVGRRRLREEPETRIKALAWGFVLADSPLTVPRSERDIRKMKIALLEHGPLAVHLAIDENKQFNAYREEQIQDGVYVIDTPVEVNHNALLIGWDDKRDAWILLNSFGKDWGGPCIDVDEVKAHFPFVMHNVDNMFGDEGGCMYIKRGVSSVGKLASWIETPLLNEDWFAKARSEKAAREAAKQRPIDSSPSPGGEQTTR